MRGRLQKQAEETNLGNSGASADQQLPSNQPTTPLELLRQKGSSLGAPQPDTYSNRIVREVAAFRPPGVRPSVAASIGFGVGGEVPGSPGPGLNVPPVPPVIEPHELLINGSDYLLINETDHFLI